MSDAHYATGPGFNAHGSAIPYCAHDLSLTGAEGPAAELGRPVILWTCDGCGAVVHSP